MKIEKLTDNKIRVIINSNDLELNNLNIHTIMSKSLESQDIFLDILKKAEKELDFKTEGYKLLIEAFSLSDDFCVFMITKYTKKEEKLENPIKNNYKRLSVKKKTFSCTSKNMVYDFEDFDTFCDFCSFLSNIHIFNIKKLCKNTSLYFYNKTFYLILNDIDMKYENKNIFFSSVSEFAKISNHTRVFTYKLLEHSKPIIKNNAITICTQYFVK